MKVGFKLKMGMTLFHKQTMKELTIDRTIEQSYNEDSEEYQRLCKEYDGEIGFERSQGKDEFDAELMILLSDAAKRTQMEVIEEITHVIKQCYHQGTTGYISFAGYVINVCDFCAVRVNAFDVKIRKYEE